MDTRFTNLSTSTASATIENGNLVENFKKDAKETIDAIETKLLTKLGLMEEGLKSSSDRMEARIL